MSNEELFEMLVKQGTLLVKTEGEYSDYHIVGLYRLRRDVLLRGKSDGYPQGGVIEYINPEDFEPLPYIEASSTPDWREGYGRFMTTHFKKEESRSLPRNLSE